MIVVSYRNTMAGARRIAEQRAETPRRDALARAALAWARQQAEVEAKARWEAQRKEIELARLQHALPKPTPKTLDAVKRLVDQVAAWHGLTYDDLVGPSTERLHVVPARFDAIAAIRSNHPQMSAKAIGRVFNNRDHTTILHALTKRGMR